jgi:meso-butanediol dehydrogenase/(S,S)-butanediol dehydrogenase/diacetyl reductase
MHGRLHGKIALILEGDGEIAAATAVRFAREGARVILCGRDAESLEDAATAVADAGGSAYVLQADCGHNGQVAAVLDQAIGQFGTIDILVCCPAEHGAPRAGGEAAASQALVTMAARGGGSITIVAPPITGGRAATDAARTAAASGVRRLALEGAARAVRANLVVPGLIGTERRIGGFADASARKSAEQSIPLGRFGHPDEIAATIAFLASDDAGYITGATIIVDGGDEARRLASSPLES